MTETYKDKLNSLLIKLQYDAYQTTLAMTNHYGLAKSQDESVKREFIKAMEEFLKELKED